MTLVRSASVVCAALFAAFLAGCGDAPADEWHAGPHDAGTSLHDSASDSPSLDAADAAGDAVADSAPEAAAPDLDNDGVADSQDNCPDKPNADQWDTDGNGTGDACELQQGTFEHPFIIPGAPGSPDFHDTRDTTNALSDQVDSYPGYDQNEAGPEVVYSVLFNTKTRLSAWLAPEPDGVDIDLHLLSSVKPMTVVDRDDVALDDVLEPGRYWLVADTFSTSSGTERPGSYELTVRHRGWHDGSPSDPIVPAGDVSTPLTLPFVFHDQRDTSDALSDTIDSYPGYEQFDESGPEYVYAFTVGERARLAATIAFDEPTGTDVDLHLLSSLTPPKVISRGDTSVYGLLEPGTYYLVLDTYAKNGSPQVGPYDLSLRIRSRNLPKNKYFNDYILAAVDYLDANYRLLGYDSAVLTHDIQYGSYGTIPATGGAKTMCVAAAMEVILTGMNLWAEDTGDQQVYDFLPIESWKTLASSSIKAHIWVNHDLDSYGTADALRQFGMGENVPFEKLRPGSFINLNRTSGTGHAVVFLAFIDIHGNTYDTWNDKVVGFKYFSSQGHYDVGAGGLDYRYAVFSDYGKPTMPYRRDTGIIYSTNQHTFNTGMMWSPDQWQTTTKTFDLSLPPTVFDPVYFDGKTIDD